MTIENFTIISEVRHSLSPGKCAKCDEETHRRRKQVLAEYFDGKSYLTEPFNICPDCYSKH